MAKKQPDYGKAAKRCGEALMRMKLERGLGLSGSCYGSGDRQEAIERLRRWVELAEEHLSTENIDRMAAQIMMRLGVDAPDEDAKWLLLWNAEIAEDRRKHGQAG